MAGREMKEKLGSTRAGRPAASGPPGQAAVSRAHWWVGLVCAWVGMTPSYCGGTARSPPGASLRAPGPRGGERSPLWP